MDEVSTSRILNRFKHIFVCVALIFQINCASAPQLRLESLPTGAEVQVNGKGVGKTPFLFEGEGLEKALNSGTLSATVKLPGYQEKTLILKPTGIANYKIELDENDRKYFLLRTINDFSVPLNEMTRKILVCQGHIFSERLEEAEKCLLDVQQNYPTLASTFVLLSNIHLIRKETSLALTTLKKAVELDPTDNVARRLYEQIKLQGGSL